jgi:flagellar biosynthesis GTPase FlhF
MAEDMKTIGDKAAQLLREKGALLTMDIARALNLSSLIAGAVLSGLVSKKIAEVSSLKVGSSPVYYVPQRKHLLEQFVQHLGSKEKEAFDMLKSKKVIRDSELEPAERVAMSQIKDFAIPIEAISKDGSSEKFWKLYSISNEHVKDILLEKQRKGVIERDAKLTEIAKIKREPEPKEEKEEKQQEEPEKTESEPKGQENKEGKQEKEPEKKEKQKENREEDKQKEQAKQKSQQEKETEPEREEPAKPDFDKNSFTEKVFNFFSENSVSVISFNIVKKDKEFNCVASFPTPFGRARYYVFCKNKSRVSDQDISDAYIDAMNKHLPLVFITSGKLTKKCVESLGSKFKSILVKVI